MQLDKLVTPLNKSQILSLEESLNECVAELKVSLSVLNKEIMGFCALTGKSSLLSQIGKHISDDYDFDTLASKLEKKKKKLASAMFAAKEALGSQTEIPDSLIGAVQAQIDSANKLTQRHNKMLRLIGRHNETAKQYALSVSGVEDLAEAGWFSRRFNSEHKKASELLTQIKGEFKTDFDGFLNSIKENRKRLESSTRDLEMKKSWREGYDFAVSQYKKASEKYKKFDIHEEFCNILVRAFSDKTFISAFAGVASDAGRSVILAAFKHMLMRSILDKANAIIERFISQPVDLNEQHNLNVFMSDIKSTISQFSAVSAIKATVEIGRNFSFDDMYRRYLKEISEIAGVSTSEFRRQEIDFSGGVVVEKVSFGVLTQHASSLDVAQEGVRKQAGFASILANNNHPSNKLSLSVS